MTKIAIIGGSGLYKLDGQRQAGTGLLETLDISTPFGPPSDSISIIDVRGERVAFLPRHGKGHRHLPTEVPSLANIWALKSIGVEQIISISAVGSLQEAFRPGDFVLCDQLIDRTRSRVNSFFGGGVVGHLPFADPYCSRMRSTIAGLLEKSGHPFHGQGTLICMEGPLFSTRAESELYRSWGAHLVGMTALPEAKLAREAEICLAIVAMITDYDCWRESEEDVSVEMVLKVMAGNTRVAREMIPDFIEALIGDSDCACRKAAEKAIMTDPALIPGDIKRKLEQFYGKYWRD